MMTTLFSLSAYAGDFTVGKGTFLLNGEPFIVKAAEMHYPRIPRPYWEHRIRSCKALGMNTICMCGVGDGRPALVALEEERYTSS